MTDEAAARDAALDRLEERRAVLIHVARTTANQLALKHGTVTAPAVLRAMIAEAEERGCTLNLDGIDPRWMGAVFRAGQGWERVGWTPEGSHCRPVAVWRRREEAR